MTIHQVNHAERHAIDAVCVDGPQCYHRYSERIYARHRRGIHMVSRETEVRWQKLKQMAGTIVI